MKSNVNMNKNIDVAASGASIVFNANNIKFQVSELGKQDAGGGGTIAYILANKGLDVIDCGIPILSMHSPYELSSKHDIYTAYRAYSSFFRM